MSSSLKKSSQCERNSVNDSILTSANTTAFTRQKKRKVIMLGTMGVGKSSIVKRFMDNTLPRKPQLTNEETHTKTYNFNEEALKMMIIDTAGQSEFTPALPNRYCIGVHGYVLTFSIDNMNSFEVVKHVNQILLENVGNKYIPRVLVANKSDLEGSGEVPKDEIQKLAKNMKCPFINCSAIKDDSCKFEEIFQELLKEINKEINDEYPYDIKNTQISMNFIRQHHKTFTILLLTFMGVDFCLGLFFLFCSLLQMVSKQAFLNPYLIVGIIFALASCLNSFRGFTVVKNHMHQTMGAVNKVIYACLVVNLALLIMMFALDTGLNESIWTVNVVLFMITFTFKVASIVLNNNLQPFYKEFYTSGSMGQKLL